MFHSSKLFIIQNKKTIIDLFCAVFPVLQVLSERLLVIILHGKTVTI